MTNYDDEANVIDFEFREISKCIAAIEKVLNAQSERADNDIDHFFENGNWDNVEQELPSLLEQSHLAKSRFPDLFYRGLIVTIWSGFEDEMLRLAKTWINYSGHPPNPKERLYILSDVRRFWESRGVEYPQEWKALADIQTVRNLIVHQNGSLAFDEHRDQLQQSRAAEVLVYIRERNSRGIENLTPANNAVEVTAGFCQELSGLCGAFLQGAD